MTHSEHINEIASALAKSQGEMRNPGADTHNLFQKYTYAQVDQFLDIIRGPLSRNGISFNMDVERYTSGEKSLLLMLSHTSGQWFKFTMPLEKDIEPNKGNSLDQVWGSHLTYRKKSLIGLAFGIHNDKDADGYEEKKQEENMNKSVPQEAQNNKPKTGYEKVTSEQVQAIMFEIGEHTEVAEILLRHFGIQKLSELPKDYYLKIIERIRANVQSKKQ